MSEADRTVIVETVVAAPYKEVWEALRDPERIRRWHGWEAPSLDEEVEFIYVTHAEASEADGTVDFPGVGLRFDVTDLGDGTRISVTKPVPADDDAWSAWYDDIDEGWITFFNQLRFALERHPGQERRTLHLDGRAVEGVGPLTLAELGLDEAAKRQPGEAYSGELPWGEAIGGTVWHRAEHQVGLTVDAFGDGLLVLHAQPERARPPRGGGMVILTTYGLDDEALAGLSFRWSTWFTARYAAAVGSDAGQQPAPAGTPEG